MGIVNTYVEIGLLCINFWKYRKIFRNEFEFISEIRIENFHSVIFFLWKSLYLKFTCIKRDQFNCCTLYFFTCCWKVFDICTHIYAIWGESSLKLCIVKVSDQNWYISAWLLYQVLLRQKSMFNAAWNSRQNFQTGWRSYRNCSN